MNLREARKELDRPLVFGDAKQIEAVTFIENAEVLAGEIESSGILKHECDSCHGSGEHRCEECDDEHMCQKCGGEGFSTDVPRSLRDKIDTPAWYAAKELLHQRARSTTKARK